MPPYVIIGSGAAGIAAIESIRSQDAHGEILLIADEAHGYYSRPGLAYVLTGEIPEKSLFPFFEQDFRRLSVRRLHARAVGLHPETHQIELHNGDRVPYRKLLIATGATAMRANVPGADLEGVLKLDNLDDVRRLLKLGKRGHTAVVVGGGITALELAEGLACQGVSVHYFLRGDRYWSNVLDESESRLIEHRLKEDGIHIHYQTDLAEILGKQGKVSGVRAADGRQFKCDLIAVAIGVRPRLELAQDGGLKVERGILVDEFLRSSAADVFAAGDVAQVFDPLSGKAVLDSLWGPARAQGHIAGLNMAGQQCAYRKLVAFNVTRLSGLTTTIIGAVGQGADADLAGIARGDSEAWRQPPAESGQQRLIAAQANFAVNHLRLMVGKKSLTGAIVMGDQTLSTPLQQLIGAQADIAPLRTQLLQPAAPLGELIASFYAQWKQAARPSAR